MNKKPMRRVKNFELLNQSEIVIDLPPLAPQKIYRIPSVRLKHPERAEDFFKVIVEEPAFDAAQSRFD